METNHHIEHEKNFQVEFRIFPLPETNIHSGKLT